MFSLLFVLLSACGTARAVKSLFGGIFPVEVRIAEGLNERSPVAVDVVVVYKKGMLAKLSEMKARDWFGKREQMLRDQKDVIDVWPFEWVPGQPVESLALPYRVGAAGGVIFADYFSAGAHRAVVDPHQPVLLLLEEEGFTVEPLR